MNQNTSGQIGPQEQSNDSGISLLDILVFLRRSYKLIVIMGIVGVAASFGYLLVTPKQYRASAQIQMAQIGIAGGNYSTLGVNIEDPALLTSRLSFPSSFTAEDYKACGLGSEKDPQATFSKIVKLTVPKGVTNVVDLKIIGTSPEATFICAQTLFNLIKNSQAEYAKSYIKEVKEKLLNNQERLANAKDFLMKADKSSSAMSVAYLSTRDEIRFLLDENATLRNLLNTTENRETRLVAPIYINNHPIAPKKRVVLPAGLFGGLFLGLLIAFGRQIICSLKAQYDDNIPPAD